MLVRRLNSQMSPDEDLVSVIVPAYNAGTTLDETLASVRGQTYRNLEILVVDDGSTDDTVAVADRHAAVDSRVRILSIANSGVANARNAGIAASRGEFVAPVDADDVWHPEKIARQMAIIRSDPDMGYVYTLFRRIDDEGRVLYSSGIGDFVGHVYLRSLLVNFVGNGSCLLARRAALDAVGGYEPDLHRRGVQGCEDHLVQILIARAWTVGLVPAYLTGYRRRADAMSADRERMMRSHLAVLEQVARRFPETPAADLAAAEAAIRGRFAVWMLRQKRLREAAREFLWALRLSPCCAVDVAAVELSRTVQGSVRHRMPKAAAAGVHFVECDPAWGCRPYPKRPLRRRLAALARREAAFFQTQPFVQPSRPAAVRVILPAGAENAAAPPEERLA
jgi:hypothetical protein